MIDLERDEFWLFRTDGYEVGPRTEPDALLYNCDGPPNTLVDLALGKDVRNCSPGELGARAVEILDAAYRSARSGQLETIAAVIKRVSLVRRQGRHVARGVPRALDGPARGHRPAAARPARPALRRRAALDAGGGGLGRRRRALVRQRRSRPRPRSPTEPYASLLVEDRTLVPRRDAGVLRRGADGRSRRPSSGARAAHRVDELVRAASASSTSAGMRMKPWIIPS